MPIHSRRHFLIAGGALLLSPPARSSAAHETAQTLQDAIDHHARALHLHGTWVRDPFIALGPDGFYYYTGTTQEQDLRVTAETQANTGLGASSLVGWHIRAWRSPDLIAWHPLGPVASLKDTTWYSAARDAFDAAPETAWKIWAPELHWINGSWAIVFTTPAPLKPEVGASLLRSNSRSLQAPWQNPLGDRVGIRPDPSLFRDDDGTWWMIWAAATIAPLTPDLSAYAAPPTELRLAGAFPKIGHEGCTILKIHGRYVLFGTGWSTCQMRKGSYNLYYATADQVTGPYSERRFVGRFLGHGTPFQDKQGQWWCTAFYNGNTPPLDAEGIEHRDLSATAQTINPQGLTIVPLTVSFQQGDIVIRASDPRYATPGPDELQKFR